MPARPSSSLVSASRRSPPPAAASPSPSGSPTARSRWTRSHHMSPLSTRRRTCPSRSISRTAMARARRTPPGRSRARRRPEPRAARSRDFDRDDGELYERERAVERIAAATEAADALDFPFTLTARAENHLRGNPDLDDTIARLRAFEEAGADVLYAPALLSAEEIKTVCDAVSKPVNVLAFSRLGLTFAEIADAGAQRVSVGSGLTWAATDGLIEAAARIIDKGDFSGTATPGRVKEWL